MLADFLLVYGGIFGSALLVAAGVHVGERLSTPPVLPPRFRDRFQKLWYSKKTRCIYGIIWQRNVWYEIAYSGVDSIAPLFAKRTGLRRLDGGPTKLIDDDLLVVIQGLWWIENSGNLPHIRRELNDFIINQEKIRKRP
jgi:hypothetical protein